MFLINNYCRKSYCESKIQLKLLIGSTSPQIIYWKPKNNLRSNTLCEIQKYVWNREQWPRWSCPIDALKWTARRHPQTHSFINYRLTSHAAWDLYKKLWFNIFFWVLNIFGSPLSAYYFLARDKYMFYVTIKLQCFDVKLQR